MHELVIQIQPPVSLTEINVLMAIEGWLIMHIAERHLGKQEKITDTFLFNGLYGMLTVLLPLQISQTTVDHNVVCFTEAEPAACFPVNKRGYILSTKTAATTFFLNTEKRLKNLCHNNDTGKAIEHGYKVQLILINLNGTPRNMPQKFILYPGFTDKA